MKRKLIAMAAAGVMLVSMAPAFSAYADDAAQSESVAVAPVAGAEDVVVNTSIGSGQVIFTKTDKAADLTAAELTTRVKDALGKIKDLEAMDAFLDAEADVSIKLGEENQMGIQASAITTAQEYDHKQYASFFYTLSGLGEPMSGTYEAYHWDQDDVHYTSVSDGNGWKTKAEDAWEEIMGYVEIAVESEEANQISLDGLLPNLYEEDGKQYYVCVMDKNMLMNTAQNVGKAQGFLPTVDSILGDNDVKLTVVVNAETGLVRAMSLNASGAKGQIPGSVLGAEGSLEFSADQLYCTFLFSPEADNFSIPDEVLNTPVENEYEMVENLVSGLGSILGSVTE